MSSRVPCSYEKLTARSPSLKSLDQSTKVFRMFPIAAFSARNRVSVSDLFERYPAGKVNWPTSSSI